LRENVDRMGKRGIQWDIMGYNGISTIDNGDIGKKEYHGI